MRIHVDYEIEKCSDCPFCQLASDDAGVVFRTCVHWRKHGTTLIVDSSIIAPGCDLLSGDAFLSLHGDIMKGV